MFFFQLTTHAIIDSQQFFAKGSILDAMFDGFFFTLCQADALLNLLADFC